MPASFKLFVSFYLFLIFLLDFGIVRYFLFFIFPRSFVNKR